MFLILKFSLVLFLISLFFIVNVLLVKRVGRGLYISLMSFIILMTLQGLFIKLLTNVSLYWVFLYLKFIVHILIVSYSYLFLVKFLTYLDLVFILWFIFYIVYTISMLIKSLLILFFRKYFLVFSISVILNVCLLWIVYIILDFFYIYQILLGVVIITILLSLLIILLYIILFKKNMFLFYISILKIVEITTLLYFILLILSYLNILFIVLYNIFSLYFLANIFHLILLTHLFGSYIGVILFLDLFISNSVLFNFLIISFNFLFIIFILLSFYYFYSVYLFNLLFFKCNTNYRHFFRSGYSLGKSCFSQAPYRSHHSSHDKKKCFSYAEEANLNCVIDVSFVRGDAYKENVFNSYTLKGNSFSGYCVLPSHVELRLLDIFTYEKEMSVIRSSFFSNYLEKLANFLYEEFVKVYGYNIVSREVFIPGFIQYATCYTIKRLDSGLSFGGFLSRSHHCFLYTVFSTGSLSQRFVKFCEIRSNDSIKFSPFNGSVYQISSITSNPYLYLNLKEVIDLVRFLERRSMDFDKSFRNFIKNNYIIMGDYSFKGCLGKKGYRTFLEKNSNSHNIK